MMKKFALITGGSRGLGSHLVRRFWLDGYSLVVVARGQAAIQTLLNQLPKRNDQSAIPFSCDLAVPDELAALIDKIKRLIPHLDVIINNAALQGPIGPSHENDPSEWRQALQVNLFAPVFLCQGLISLMKNASSASIINLSGGGATGPRPNFSAYATAKAGLVRFSETIAEELRSNRIRVNCIAPGAMKTSMLDEVLNNSSAAGEHETSLAHKVIAEGGASMDRVADLALFLASPVSEGITGKLISAVWDRWEQWPLHLDELSQGDVYTLRRIVGRDRGFNWGDK